MLLHWKLMKGPRMCLRAGSDRHKRKAVEQIRAVLLAWLQRNRQKRKSSPREPSFLANTPAVNTLKHENRPRASEVAGDEVVCVFLAPLRLFLAADVLAVWASGMEGAS